MSLKLTHLLLVSIVFSIFIGCKKRSSESEVKGFADPNSYVLVALNGRDSCKLGSFPEDLYTYHPVNILAAQITALGKTATVMHVCLGNTLFRSNEQLTVKTSTGPISSPTKDEMEISKLPSYINSMARSSRIILFGHSYGGWGALYVASKLNYPHLLFTFDPISPEDCSEGRFILKSKECQRFPSDINAASLENSHALWVNFYQRQGPIRSAKAPITGTRAINAYVNMDNVECGHRFIGLTELAWKPVRDMVLGVVKDGTILRQSLTSLPSYTGDPSSVNSKCLPFNGTTYAGVNQIMGLTPLTPMVSPNQPSATPVVLSTLEYLEEGHYYSAEIGAYPEYISFLTRTGFNVRAISGGQNSVAQADMVCDSSHQKCQGTYRGPALSQPVAYTTKILNRYEYKGNDGTGEVHYCHESRSIAGTFALKKFTTDDYHEASLEKACDRLAMIYTKTNGGTAEAALRCSGNTCNGKVKFPDGTEGAHTVIFSTDGNSFNDGSVYYRK